MIQKQAEGKSPLDSQPTDEEDEEEEYDEPEQEVEPEAQRRFFSQLKQIITKFKS